MKSVILIIFLNLIFINCIASQGDTLSNNIELGGACYSLNQSSVCYSLLNYTSYYLSPNTTFEQVNKKANESLVLLDFTSNQCKQDAQYIFCAQLFPNCNGIDVSKFNNNGSNATTIYLPSLPCNSLCLNSQKSCSKYIKLVGLDLTCDSSYDNGIPMFPSQFTNYSLAQLNISGSVDIQCINSSLINIQNSTISCPSPLLNARDYVKSGKITYYYASDECIVDCPFHIYPESRVLHLKRVHTGLTIISFILTTFMILTFGVLPNKVSHRMESILSFSIGAWLTCLCVFVQRSDDDFGCSNDRGRYKSQSDHLCLFVGLLFQGGAITAALWAPMIGYDLYLNSIIKKIENYIRYRIAIWSTIVMLTAIPAFAGKYGSTIASDVCWLSGEKGGVWQYIFLIIPSWIAMIFVTIFLVLSVKNFTKMYLQSPNNMVLFYNIKTMFTTILIIFVITFATSFKFYMDSKHDDFFKSVYEWAICLTKNEEKECQLNSPGFEITALNTVAVSLLGLGVFIGFGLEPSSKIIWKESNKLNWVISKLGLNKYLKLTSTTTTTTTSTLTNSNSDSNSNNKRDSTNVKLNKINNSSNNHQQT